MPIPKINHIIPIATQKRRFQTILYKKKKTIEVPWKEKKKSKSLKFN